MDINISSNNSVQSVCVRGFRGMKCVKPGCSEDDYAVAILPDDWIPKRSGPILTNYLKQREQDHNNIHKDILKCAEIANNEINAKLKQIAECLWFRINLNQIEMDCLVDDCHHTSAGVLSNEARDIALKTIKELCLRRVNDKAIFTKEATDLEKERVEKLKGILREKFHRLISVGHMTPKELLHDFDQRIYELNQQLLSNCRAFTALETKLRVQLDDSVLHAKSSLNQLSLGIVVAYRGRRTHSAIRHSIVESISQRRLSTINMRQTSISIVLNDVTMLEVCVGRIVEAYRGALMSIFTGFYNKMANLEKDLFAEKDIHMSNFETEFADINKIIAQPMRRLSAFYRQECSNEALLAVTQSDVRSMHRSLWSLGECLRDTYLILYHAGHLWDAHILRNALAQTLTIAAVEDLLTHHDKIELAAEIPINITFDKLRCAADENKLDEQLEVIVRLLNQTAEMYLEHSESELRRLEEFMKLPPAMTQLLLSEFELFLRTYPRTRYKSFDTVPRQLTLSRKPSYLRQPLPRALMQTELQEMSLQNWRNGFLESFEGNIATIPDELKHQGQLWVEVRSTSLHMRYSLKMISHNVRIDRAKAAMKARLAELRHHQYRLNSHLTAVYEFIEKIITEASQFVAIDDPYLYPIGDWVKRIQTNLNELLAEETPNPQAKILKIASYAIRVPRYRHLYEQSLDKAIAEYKHVLEYRIHEVRISNVRFLSQIKLFSEGGNYAAQEAMKTSAALDKATNALVLCFDKAFEAVQKRRTELLAYVDNNYIRPVMNILDSHRPSKVTSKINKNKKNKGK